MICSGLGFRNQGLGSVKDLGPWSVIFFVYGLGLVESRDVGLQGVQQTGDLCAKKQETTHATKKF